MDWSWITTAFTAVGPVLLAAVAIYISLIVLTRMAGLRSFSKLSSFDFAITVAIGSVIASTMVSGNPPLVEGAVALASLYGLQMLTAVLRQHSHVVRRAVSNTPMVIMVGNQIVEENLRAARMTKSDVRAKLREAGVIELKQVRAVVMESTGDVSVLQTDSDSIEVDAELLEGVVGGELLLKDKETAESRAL